VTGEIDINPSFNNQTNNPLHRPRSKEQIHNNESHHIESSSRIQTHLHDSKSRVEQFLLQHQQNQHNLHNNHDNHLYHSNPNPRQHQNQSNNSSTHSSPLREANKTVKYNLSDNITIRLDTITHVNNVNNNNNNSNKDNVNNMNNNNNNSNKDNVNNMNPNNDNNNEDGDNNNDLISSTKMTSSLQSSTESLKKNLRKSDKVLSRRPSGNKLNTSGKGSKIEFTAIQERLNDILSRDGGLSKENSNGKL
jgi:hypothetical protein